MKRTKGSIAGLASMLVVLASLTMTNPAHTGAPTPGVPQFTLKLAESPYDVPPIAPTCTIDPYTGAQKLVSPGQTGYQVDNWTIELSIKNQPLPHSNSSYPNYQIYYDIRVKKHFTDSWNDLYPAVNLDSSEDFWYLAPYIPNSPPASTSSYTLLSFPASDYPAGQVDFQVKALIGHEHHTGKLTATLSNPMVLLALDNSWQPQPLTHQAIGAAHKP